MNTWPGSAYPLGATFDGNGTNFALYSEAAEKVELCLFDDDLNAVAHRLDHGSAATDEVRMWSDGESLNG